MAVLGTELLHIEIGCPVAAKPDHRPALEASGGGQFESAPGVFGFAYPVDPPVEVRKC